MHRTASAGGGRGAACRISSARSAVLAVLLVSVASSGRSQTSHLSDPLRYWQHESEYAGAEACRACHADTFNRQQSSNHAATLRPAREAQELVTGLPVTRIDRASGFALTLERGPHGALRIRAEQAHEEIAGDLEWAFGSGLKGVTPIGRTADGDWFESRLTWYASLGGIDFTTGATQHDASGATESLGRKLSGQEVAECFGCHTTGYDERSSGPRGAAPGVRCERCHGPGLEHVRAAAGGDPAPGRIFHPRDLGGFAQTQMCGACHGRPPQDNDFDALALLERTPHSVRFPSQRIVLSRCFNESFGELACTTCHDPHGDVADETGGLDAACLSCHDKEARERASVCPVSSARCSSCHMPKERVMRHSTFGDHWIRVVHSD